VALAAAAEELARAKTPTRHLLLFADAADSEEPADYRETLARMKQDGITVSVIGMGTPQDKDAALLTEIARLGNGQIYFSDRVDELPRLFAEDTIVLARAAFVDSATRLTLSRDMALLGAPEGGALPALGGYNLTYLRPTANIALRTADDNAAPVLSFWKHGLGSAAAFTGEVDGQYSGGLREWTGFRSLFGRVVRQLMPAPDSGEVSTKSRLAGDVLDVTVEVEDAESVHAAPASVTVVSGNGAREPVTLPLHWEDGHHLRAQLPLASGGAYFPLATVAGHVYRVAPVALPYPGEWQWHDPGAGRALLESLARMTGGKERLSTRDVFDHSEERPGRRPIGVFFVWAALLFLVGEVALRRLLPAGVPLPQIRLPFRSGGRASRASEDVGLKKDTPSPPPDTAKSSEKESGGMSEALDSARARARKRF
jgi:hypothetical protein